MKACVFYDGRGIDGIETWIDIDQEMMILLTLTSDEKVLPDMSNGCNSAWPGFPTRGEEIAFRFNNKSEIIHYIRQYPDNEIGCDHNDDYKMQYNREYIEKYLA